MKVLVVNAGSSSLKYQLFDMNNNTVLAKGICERIGLDESLIKHKNADGSSIESNVSMNNHSEAMKEVINALTDPSMGCLSDMSEIEAVGHRVVHGGPYFFESCLVTDEVMDKLKKCVEFAPLHTPAHIMGIEACLATMPNVPQVLVFDTAFHQTMPDYAYTYGISKQIADKYHIRKYGAHGTSHRFVSMKAIELLGGEAAGTHIVTCHIGNGSSVSAVKDGKVIDTSMGFTPLDGLLMGTRCGSIDPAIVTFIMDKEGLTPDQMNDYMNKQCGIAGVSEISSDSRDIEAAIEAGSHQALLTAEILAYQVKKTIGSYAAAMNGLDAIVFTAGLGENNPQLRERVLTDMDCFGIQFDQELNQKILRQPNIVELSTKDSKVKVYVIPTDEEFMIASDTKEIVTKAK
ncbi:MAG: acetate kinase [Clostridiales bacterium]|nr:acetate kinase [Clostridiales bacterium]